MRDVMEAVESWFTSGDRVALATVVDTKKSAPQPWEPRWLSTTGVR